MKTLTYLNTKAMNKFMLNSKETAQRLIEMKFTAAHYEDVQKRRRERLETFRQHKVTVLVEGESELIKFGEDVLRLLKEHEASR